MGIDPVTHSPRLDLLDLSSILRSTLYNSSQMNLSSLIGVQPLVNPELLKLAASLMSSERKSPSFSPQNSTQTIQFSHPQLQMQVPLQEIVQFPHEPQLVEPIASELNDQWPSGPILPSNLIMDCNFELPGFDYCGLDQQQPAAAVDRSYETPTFSSQDGNNNNQNNFSLSSVLSSPCSSSSPTQMNSNSTYFTSATEDERESYCSQILNFQIPDIFDESFM